MAINKELWEKAQGIVRAEVEEEQNVQVKEEYDKLLFQSQLVPAGKKLESIKKLLRRAIEINPRGMGDGYKLHSLRSDLRDYVEKKHYHPARLKEIGREVGRRLKKQDKL